MHAWDFMRVANPFPRYRSPVAAVLAALLLLAVGCGGPTTSTTQVLSADLSERQPLRSVLVIGSIPGAAERRELEDNLAAQLSKRGVRARSSHELFPARTPNNEEAREAALKSGLNGVLVTRLRHIERREQYVPPSGPPVGPPVTLVGSPYGGGGTTPLPYEYAATRPPGRFVVNETVELETTVWDPRGGRAQWTATTRTKDPKSGTALARSLAKEVIPRMETAGLVPREP